MKANPKQIARMIQDLEAWDIDFRIEVKAEALSPLKAGGVIAIVAEPESYLSLKQLATLLSAGNYPFFIMGALSNTLVPTEGFPLAISTRRLRGVEVIGNRVYVGGGEPLQSLVLKTAQYGLAGLEHFVGIPASVGGAVFMNAGCFGAEICDKIESINIFDFDLLRGGQLTRGQIEFSYRRSGLLRDRELVLAVEFCLAADDPIAIKARMGEYRARRNAAQPQEPSLGSTFLRTNNVSAGYYIDKAGLKGAREGGMVVSEKHAGFLVNTGGGSAEDYLHLLAKVRREVEEQFGVRLLEEIRII